MLCSKELDILSEYFKHGIWMTSARVLYWPSVTFFFLGKLLLAPVKLPAHYHSKEVWLYSGLLFLLEVHKVWFCVPEFDYFDVIMMLWYFLQMDARINMYAFLQMNLDLSVADGHLCNMGRMIEEMESKLRNSLDQVCWFSFFTFQSQASYHSPYTH